MCRCLLPISNRLQSVQVAQFRIRIFNPAAVISFDRFGRQSSGLVPILSNNLDGLEKWPLDNVGTFGRFSVPDVRLFVGVDVGVAA